MMYGGAQGARGGCLKGGIKRDAVATKDMVAYAYTEIGI